MNSIKDKVNSKMSLGSSQIQEITDNLPVRGSVQCWVEENGVKTLHHEKSNLIVNGARKALAHLVAMAAANYQITTFKLGTGGHATGDILTPVSPTINDTDLEIPFFTKSIDHGSDVYLPTPPAETSVQFTIVVDTFEGNGTGTVAYCEAGLYTVDGTMFARETFPAIVKNSSRRVTFLWALLF